MDRVLLNAKYSTIRNENTPTVQVTTLLIHIKPSLLPKQADKKLFNE